LKTKKIANQVVRDFSDIYTHFKEFQQNDEYRRYWNKCLESVRDRDFLICAIFCNDVFGIPPVKTFLANCRDEFILLTGDKHARLDIFVKRGIGAFWAMVFKVVLGYTEQKSVSVSMNDYFFVKTATVYSGRASKTVIE
jgi:hypothetical protein